MPFGTAFKAAKNGTGEMCKNTKKKSAARLEKTAGYSSAVPDIASAWQQFCNEPENGRVREQLAIEIDAILKMRLPIGRLSGLLQRREEDIRQQAYMLLVGKYLCGNRKLLAATVLGNRPEIRSQIERSISGSIRTISRNMKHAQKRHLEYHVYCEVLNDEPQATSIHPAGRMSLWELPFADQRALVFDALAQAVSKKLIRARNARIAMEMVDAKLNQRQIAKSLGISPQAIHRILAPVRKHLPKIIESQEFPW